MKLIQFFSVTCYLVHAEPVPLIDIFKTSGSESLDAILDRQTEILQQRQDLRSNRLKSMNQFKFRDSEHSHTQSAPELPEIITKIQQNQNYLKRQQTDIIKQNSIEAESFLKKINSLESKYSKLEKVNVDLVTRISQFEKLAAQINSALIKDVNSVIEGFKDQQKLTVQGIVKVNKKLNEVIKHVEASDTDRLGLKTDMLALNNDMKMTSNLVSVLQTKFDSLDLEKIQSHENSPNTCSNACEVYIDDTVRKYNSQWIRNKISTAVEDDNSPEEASQNDNEHRVLPHDVDYGSYRLEDFEVLDYE